MFGYKQAASYTAFIALITTMTVTTSANAFDSTQRGYGAMLRAAEQTAKVPASFRIVRNTSQTPARLTGNARYLGGQTRVVLVDGHAVKLPESEIVENIRNGHFVPVYEQSGEKLRRDDWIISLPGWLGHATIDSAR